MMEGWTRRRRLSVGVVSIQCRAGVGHGHRWWGWSSRIAAAYGMIQVIVVQRSHRHGSYHSNASQGRVCRSGRHRRGGSRGCGQGPVRDNTIVIGHGNRNRRGRCSCSLCLCRRRKNTKLIRVRVVQEFRLWCLDVELVRREVGKDKVKRCPGHGACVLNWKSESQRVRCGVAWGLHKDSSLLEDSRAS